MKRAILPPEFREMLRALPKGVRRDVGAAITAMEQSFGQPHLHQGLGMRPLRDDYYEVRLGLKLRLVFRHLREGLNCEMIGSHDDVKRFMRSR